MVLSTIFKKLHKLIEYHDGGGSITNQKMANFLKCDHDTYRRYRLGITQPVGVDHFLKLINRLDDDQIIEIIRHYDRLTNPEKYPKSE